ncbi:MAG: hypothetical protein M3198_13410, partial [Actinomycetota bacterium]|nr:hypothetical protein [Actinomycetota bacterium]
PALLLEITDLAMDRSFVLANGGFLAATLLDDELARELPAALGAVRRLRAAGQEQEAIRIARLALRYLFEEPNIFNTPDTVGGLSTNEPALSYDASVIPPDLDIETGLTDAVQNRAGVVFTTMNFFFRVWSDLTETQRDEQAIGTALALAEGTRAKWEAFATAETDNAMNTLESLTGDFSDALRRLSGFLAVVDGMLKPLMLPLEHEREAAAAAERAEFVIRRIVEHLSCHQDYYVQRFVAYLAARTNHVTVARFAADVIDRLLVIPEEQQEIREALDPASTFLDRSEIIVPSPLSYTYEELLDILGGSPDDYDEHETPSALAQVDLPFDGVHIEIAPGTCVLPDVPEPVADLNVEVTQR